MGKIVKISFGGESEENGQMYLRFRILKIFGLHGLVCPHPVAIYMYIAIILNLFSETAWPIKDKLHVEHPKEGGTNVCINGPGHMTKMATIAINRKETLKIFS